MLGKWRSVPLSHTSGLFSPVFFCDPSAVASSVAGITTMQDYSWQEPPLLTGTQLLTL